MTPKEKATKLFDKFRVKVHDRDGTSAMNGFEAKQCAKISVDEILNEFPQGFKGNFEERRKQYWEEVKQEIENL
jgi:hypothetical protein